MPRASVARKASSSRARSARGSGTATAAAAWLPGTNAAAPLACTAPLEANAGAQGCDPPWAAGRDPEWSVFVLMGRLQSRSAALAGQLRRSDSCPGSQGITPGPRGGTGP